MALIPLIEWPRSESARLQSLEGSGNRVRHILMTRIVAKQQEGDEMKKEVSEEVVGHASLTREWNPFHDRKKKDDVVNILIQSVVIHPNLRGKGLGRQLMQHLEEFVLKELSVASAWIPSSSPSSPSPTIRFILHPKDDSDGSIERFYTKLGFKRCRHDNLCDENDLQAQTEAFTPAVMKSPAPDNNDNKNITSTLSFQGTCSEGNEKHISSDMTIQSPIPSPPPLPLPAKKAGNERECNTPSTSFIINSKRGKQMYKLLVSHSFSCP